MSHKATAWAYAQPIDSAGRKFCLVALADFADEAHSCFPGQDRIAAMTGQSVESVRRHLKALEEDGYLTRYRRSGSDGYRTSDRYVLNVAGAPTGGGEPVIVQESPDPLPNKVTGRETKTAPNPQIVGAPTGQTEGVLPVNLPDLTGQSEGVTVREPSGNRKGGRSASRRKPETPLPDGWKPTAAHQSFALEHGLELSSEAMKFRTHAAANDRRLRSWDAGFTMWLLNAKKYAPKVDGTSSAWERARRVGEWS